MVRFVSTRGGAGVRSFEDVLLAGLAEDGGLFVPDTWPQLDIAALKGATYPDTVAAVISGFVGHCFSTEDIRSMCHKAYQSFVHPAIAPLVQLDRNLWVLELFHGPTLAFKDFALQLLALMYEQVLERRGERLTIVGATSGDTGSAAIHALAGRDNVDVCILHPHNRVSEIQRRQMTTEHAGNILNVAVSGTFDDCQDRVKDMFNDHEFRNRMKLGAVNSINFARIAAQIAYYVYAAVRISGPAHFSVPTGNFGDIFAGYMAAKMGLPVKSLIVATNQNDILARFFQTGDYKMEAVKPSMSPSMDIQISSNFERLLFDIVDRDASKLSQLMANFRKHGQFALDLPSVRQKVPEFSACCISEDQTLDLIRHFKTKAGYLCDPHTAVGLGAASRLLDAAEPVITLATAHPAKFPNAIEAAIDSRAELPARCSHLYERDERFVVVANELGEIKSHIMEAFQ